ncbi:MAG: 2-hydroxyacid dehydrogenase [Candidatus Dormibacteraeota bacterium]|nr:2-hydroxyacid dehydrogenase [Candidatus Dormibacteraeota bacterium]
MADGQLVVSTAPVPPEFFAGALPDGTRVVRATAEDVTDLVADADVIIGDWSHTIKLTAEVIGRAGRCRLIQQPSAGFENIDVAAADEAGIPVANAGPANSAAVAEHAIMGTLGVLRYLRDAIRDTEAGDWDQEAWIARDVRDLNQRVVGILGFGSIGQAIAERLRPFGSTTLYHRRNRMSAEDEARLGAEYAELDDLLARSEVLIVALPLNAETDRLIDAVRLAQLPEGAVLVNIARGQIVDEDALVEAFQSGRLSGAALDVFSQEPLPAGHRFAGLPNMLLTPHIGGATAQGKVNILMNSLNNVVGVLKGEPPKYVVNHPKVRQQREVG